MSVAAAPIVDPDVWWVAAAGRRMIASGQVPTQNVFSYVEPAHVWIMHEWLLGPAYAWGLDRFGPCVFVALTVAFLAVDLGLVLAATLGRARHATAGIFVAFAAVAGFGIRFLSARPTHVALIFPMAMTLIAFAPRFGLGSIAAACLVEVVWTNAHGSFPLGVVLVLLAATDCTERRSQRVAAAVLCAAVTCFNPYGTSLHRFVWGYFRGGDGIYREIHRNIVEFGNLYTAWGATVGPGDLVALALAATIAALAALRRAHRLRALFCLAFVALASLQVRHIQLAGLLTCFLLLPYIDEWVGRWPFREHERPGWRLGAAAVMLIPACLAGAGSFAVRHARRSPEEWIASGPALTHAIDRVPNGANLYAPFHVAGLVMARAFSRGVRVLFDPRNDCYSASTFLAFNALDDRNAPGEATRARLASTGTDAAMVEDGHALASFLEIEPGWKLLARSGTWRVYGRDP